MCVFNGFVANVLKVFFKWNSYEKGLPNPTFLSLIGLWPIFLLKYFLLSVFIFNQMIFVLEYREVFTKNLLNVAKVLMFKWKSIHKTVDKLKHLLIQIVVTYDTTYDRLLFLFSSLKNNWFIDSNNVWKQFCVRLNRLPECISYFEINFIWIQRIYANVKFSFNSFNASYVNNFQFHLIMSPDINDTISCLMVWG